MKFSEFSNYLEQLEQTSKRLEITAILSDLIAKLDIDEIDKAIYLALGTLKAQFESEKFNIAEKMMIRAIENAFSTGDINTQYKKLGDLGNVIINIDINRKDKKYDISTVYTHLLEIAKTQGTGSQDSKINKLAKLLIELDPLSSKYVTRIVLGTTRLGFTELTVLDALAKFSLENINKDKTLNSKELKKSLEEKYFIHPDIGLIVKRVKEKGFAGLKDIKIETGVPVLSQKAQRAGGIKEIIERIDHYWAEYKFDGTRVQLHLDRNKKINGPKQQESLFESMTSDNILLRTFTRNLEDNSHQYPDIASEAKKQIKADSIIIDCEAIGYDKKTGEFLPFQEMMQRKRKHEVSQMSIEIPLKLFIFDIIYLNGSSLLDKPLKERHEILKSVINQNETINIANHIAGSGAEDLKKYYESSKKQNLEGLIVKNPEGKYQAGARSYAWIKLKKADEKLMEDSVDAVVLGYYLGKGDRNKFGVGGFLVGIYDEDEQKFKTLSKVGTGLSDKDWEYFKKEADKYKTNELPKNVVMDKLYTPDVFLSPKLVVEIGADEISKSKTHSAGYALRFPRLLFFRTDKKAVDATSLNEIEVLYSLQKRGKLDKTD